MNSITRWCVGPCEGCDTLSAAFQNWPAWTHYSRCLCGSTVGWSTVRPSTSAVFTHTVTHVHMNCSEIISPNIAEGCGSKSLTGDKTTSLDSFVPRLSLRREPGDEGVYHTLCITIPLASLNQISKSNLIKYQSPTIARSKRLIGIKFRWWRCITQCMHVV